MNKSLIYLFLSTFLILGIKSVSFGQGDSLFIQYKVNPKGGVQLKWQMADLDVLPQVLESGFNVYRAPVNLVSNREVLGTYVKLNDQIIKPWSLDKIHTEMQKDSMISFAESFLEYLNSKDRSAGNDDLEEAFDLRAMDQNFLFVFSVAMVQNNRLAEAMGMYFEDKYPMTTKKYVYKLEVISKPKYTCYCLVDTEKDQKPEPIVSFSTSLEPKAVVLRWFNNQNKNYYAYNVYRSKSKNGGFEKINDIPFINQGTDMSKDKDYSFFVDSIQEYNQIFYYKVMGLDAFGEEAGETKVNEIKTLRLLQIGTAFFEANELSNGDVKLDWNYSAEEQEYIQKVNIFRATTPNGPYLKINPKPIDNKTFSYLDKTTFLSSNYYIAFAYGFNGDSVPSLIKAVLKIDTIAPNAPFIKKITCDTNGIVSMTWERNTELDMLGYRIFRSYDTTKEALRVNLDLVKDTILIDTVDLKLQRNKIYYRLYAFDGHYNSSMPSAYYELILPDKNPPLNGYFTETEIKFKGIELNWQPSTSPDLAQMQIWRQSELDIEAFPIKIFQKDSLYLTKFLDTTVRANTRYKYFLIAQDQSGLQSPKSKERQLTMLDNRPDPFISNLKGIVSKENRMIKLTWDLNANATSYKLMRSKDGKPMETYTYIKGNVREYYDNWLQPDTKYTYQLIAYMADGSQTLPSKPIVLKY